MIMMRLLALALSLTAAGWSSAFACSPSFPRCFPDGHCESSYRAPKWIEKKNLEANFDTVAVVTVKAAPPAQSITTKAAELTVTRVLKGTPLPHFEVGNLAANTNGSKHKTRNRTERFGLWDHMNIGAQIITDFASASCSREIKTSLIGGESYLVFLKNNRLQDAILVADKSDDLVTDIHAVLQGGDDAPNRMDAKAYLGHMTGFVEFGIKACPTAEDYRFNNSRFATAEAQDGAAFDILDARNYVPAVIDLRDLASYRDHAETAFAQFRTAQSSIREKAETNPHFDFYEAMEEAQKRVFFQCQPNTQYLALFRQPNQRGSLRYLPIENGAVDLTDIITNIKFKGPTKLSLTDVKKWIGDANGN